MDIRELLALEPSIGSIRKIDQFLAGKNPTDRDYPKALAHLAYLTYSLGDISKSFQLLFGYLEKCIDKEKPTIYNMLINIYYEQLDYDNVLKMIELKKPYLPSYNKSAYYEDLIKYYNVIGNKTELRRNLLIYLNDDISEERRLNALKILCDLLFANKEYELFKEKNKLIQSISLSLKEEDTYLESRFNEAYVLVLIESHLEALTIINDLYSSNISKDLKAKLIALNLKIYVDLKEFRKASIFEAENEYIVSDGPIDAKIMFSKECITLYTALNNRFNKNTYEEKYLALLEEEKKSKNSPKVNQNKQKNLKHKIELSFLNEQKPKSSSPIIIGKEEERVSRVKDIIKLSEATLIETSSAIDGVADMFIELNNQVFSQFRDYLRQFLILLNNVCYFEEAYLLVKDKTYKGFHYKKERLYDKKSPSLNESILLECLNLNTEIIVPNTLDTTYVDVISGKLYQDLPGMVVICFPLTKGAIMFTASSSELLTKKLNYEVLKLAIAYLSIKYNAEQNELFLMKKYQDYDFVIEHMFAGFKRQIDSYIYLSKSACYMFDCPEAISLDEFFTFVYHEDLINYKNTVNSLLNGSCKESSVRYRSERSGKLVYYQEDFTIDSDGVILSIINDISERVVVEEENELMAHFDPLSGLYNKSKLYNDLKVMIEENKFSLFALNIIDFKRYNEIYGYDFGDQLIFAVGKYLKEYDPNNSAYHLDGDKFVYAIKGANDRRSMVKLANKLGDYLTEKLNKLNHRLNIYFEIGILRYPTDTNEHSPRKIIDYLLSALSSAHSDNMKTSVACYSKEEYKEQFFQSQLVTYISEAIDDNMLALEYSQVIDISNNSCDHYHVHLNLSNYSVDEEIIYNVLKKRDMIKTVERYMIHKALYEFSQIHKETKLYFNAQFNLSYETLSDPSIVQYINEQLAFFKVPKTSISVLYDGMIDKMILDNLKKLSANQILLSTSNVDLLKQIPILYFYYKMPINILHDENDFIIILKKFCDSKNIRFVIDNVNNQQIISHYAPYGFSLYSGQAYNALLTYKEIIKVFLS